MVHKIMTDINCFPYIIYPSIINEYSSGPLKRAIDIYWRLESPHFATGDIENGRTN